MIFKGKVIIEAEKNFEFIPFLELTQGSFFGEICLIDKKSKFRLKSSNESDLYIFFLKKNILFTECQSEKNILKWLMKFSYWRHKYFKLEGERAIQKHDFYNYIK